MSSISEKRLWELWTFIATQKSASSWLTFMPIRDMEFDLNQNESFEMLWNLGTTGKFLLPPLFVSAGDIVAGGFWERQSLDFFSVRGCHPKADSYRDMSPDQIFRQHATENKRQYASRVLEVEQATFTPLVFSTRRANSYKKGRKLYNYHVMDPGKSVNCRAEISFFV